MKEIKYNRPEQGEQKTGAKPRGSRWKLADHPDSWKPYKKKVKAHDAVTSLDMMEDVQREFLLMIRDYILSIVPEVKCFCFGSRIDGTWHEESDYDILIIGQFTQDQINRIKEKKFTTKVDFAFSKNTFTDNLIEIT